MTTIAPTVIIKLPYLGNHANDDNDDGDNDDDNDDATIRKNDDDNKEVNDAYNIEVGAPRTALCVNTYGQYTGTAAIKRSLEEAWFVKGCLNE